MCEWASKLPKNLIFNEKPHPGMLLTGHPCGVNWHADMEFVTDARILFVYKNFHWGKTFLWKNIIWLGSLPVAVLHYVALSTNWIKTVGLMCRLNEIREKSELNKYFS